MENYRECLLQREVTEQKKLEKQLREQQAYNRGL
jgi:hypothetical protein